MTTATDLDHSDHAALARICTDCDTVTGARDDEWLDVTPMVSHHEHTPAQVDKAQLVIDYALSRGLVERHPCIPRLIRVMPRAVPNCAPRG